MRPVPLQPPRVGDESTADLTGIIRARRREVWAKRLTVLGSIAAVLALAAVAWFSPLLALGSASVEGSELVAGGKVADFVEAEHGGTPLPQLRLSRIEAEVLEKFPRAEAADVRYSGPQSISIAVTDRTPVIAIAAGGGYTLYDAEAVDLGTVDEAPKGLTVLESASPNEETIAAVVRFMSSLSPELRSQLSTVEAKGSEGLAGTIDTGETKASVVFGDAENASQKMQTALQLAADGRTEIDVSVPSVPVTG